MGKDGLEFSNMRCGNNVMKDRWRNLVLYIPTVKAEFVSQ